MFCRRFALAHSIVILASPESIWQEITEVDIAAFKHPFYLSMLGIPRPLRAEVSHPGVGGTRVATFSNGFQFLQRITDWQPNQRYAFSFHAKPGFRVAGCLDLNHGPFQMVSGTYQITSTKTDVRLHLTSLYELRGWRGIFLFVPVRVVLGLFQVSLLRGIRANAERRHQTANRSPS